MQSALDWHVYFSGSGRHPVFCATEAPVGENMELFFSFLQSGNGPSGRKDGAGTNRCLFSCVEATQREDMTCHREEHLSVWWDHGVQSSSLWLKSIIYTILYWSKLCTLCMSCVDHAFLLVCAAGVYQWGQIYEHFSFFFPVLLPWNISLTLLCTLISACLLCLLPLNQDVCTGDNVSSQST